MAGKTLTRTLCCLFVLTLACGTMFGQFRDLKVAPPSQNHSSFVIPNPNNDTKANITIFSNLSTVATSLYDTIFGGYYVSGPNAIDNPTDQWIAVPFINKVADHAKTLQAAIGYISGTKRVKLGIWSDSPGIGPNVALATVTITNVPTSAMCCMLAQGSIPGTGLALLANTTYWLVATTDDVNAPDFEGVWQPAFGSEIGGDVAQGGWFTFSGLVPAGAIKGTNP